MFFHMTHNNKMMMIWLEKFETFVSSHILTNKQNTALYVLKQIFFLRYFLSSLYFVSLEYIMTLL